MPKRIFITAGEVSGDQHAAALIKQLLELDPTLIIEGLGGPLMRKAGATIHIETVHHAGMGFAGAMRYFEIKKALKWTETYITTHKPNLHIGTDSPDMNVHFAKLAHGRGIPVMQYVAPQLWGWREYRIKNFRAYVDQIACILPFEPDYFAKLGVKATFVGHPLFDELPPVLPEQQPPLYPDRPPIVGLCPGSRTGEAKANYPAMLDVARALRLVFKDIKFLVPTTAATHDIVAEHSAGIHRLAYQQNAFDELVPQCDLAIVASGTATLHTAAFGVPMIAVYRHSPILWHGIGRWLIKIRTFAMVNLLNGMNNKHIVPEFIPWFGKTDDVADCAIDLLKHPLKLESQHEKLVKLIAAVGAPGASMNTAKLAMGMISPVPSPGTPGEG